MEVGGTVVGGTVQGGGGARSTERSFLRSHGCYIIKICEEGGTSSIFAWAAATEGGDVIK